MNSLDVIHSQNQTRAFGKAIGAIPSSRKISIDADTLTALRDDYEVLRRFVVSLAENTIPHMYSVEGAAVSALMQCSATYLPIGHPDRSH